MTTAYRFGRVQVRLAEREVLVDGEPVALVGRAYDLLLALIDHRDRVVTKNELLDLVWPAVVVEEHNLHTQVSIVRKIIGRGAIATIAGRGYRFVAPVDPVFSDATNSIEHFSASLLSPTAAGGLSDSSFRKPSIAVLPFTNVSVDPEQQYFSDGITEDIITDLSKVSGLMVVARNTSFARKYKGADIRTVGRELGVDSMLEGSIRRAGNRVRITAQLIDTATGTHLWAERFDREITDLFAIQDEVTRQIVDALTIALRPAQRAQITSGRTRNVEAHDRFLFGRELLRGSRDWTLEVFNQMVAAFRRAIELDPGFAGPYACLAQAYCLDFQSRLTGIPDPLDQAARFSAQALDKDPDEPEAHFVAANVAIWRRDLLLARVEADRALALNPNYAMAHGARGNIEVYLGTPLAGIPHIRRAMLLDPFFTYQTLHFLGTAYLVAGQFEAAAASLRERVRLAPKTDLSRAFLASALGHLGELDEARRIWSELKVINPKYSLVDHLARLPFQADADRDRIREGVEKTGLPH